MFLGPHIRKRLAQRERCPACAVSSPNPRTHRLSVNEARLQNIKKLEGQPMVSLRPAARRGLAALVAPDVVYRRGQPRLEKIPPPRSTGRDVRAATRCRGDKPEYPGRGQVDSDTQKQAYENSNAPSTASSPASSTARGRRPPGAATRSSRADSARALAAPWRRPRPNSPPGP